MKIERLYVISSIAPLKQVVYVKEHDVITAIKEAIEKVREKSHIGFLDQCLDPERGIFVQLQDVIEILEGMLK
jgi:hypothetical protein